MAKAVDPAVDRGCTERGRRSSHFARLGHPQVQADSSLEAGQPQTPETLCSPWDCPLPSAPSCPSFWLPFSASSSGPVCLYLGVSVYVCVSVPYHSGLCLSVSSSVALYLALSYICFSLGVSLLPSTSLYLAGSLFTNAFLTAFISISPLPFPSSIAIIWLAAPGWVGTAAVVQRDCLGTTRGTA